MSTTMVIKIYKGNEFSVINTGISKDALFYSAYEQALAQLKDILPETPREYSEEPISNIIAFCGERGEGKSSAMKTFAKAMEEATSTMKDKRKTTKEEIDSEFIGGLKTLSSSFKLLPVIDPTQMEMKNSILETVLSRLFLDFKNQWEAVSSSDSKYHDAIKYRTDMLERFQKCYKHIRTIKQETTDNEIREMSFEDSLEELSRLGDSANLRKDLYTLIQNFLTQTVDGGKAIKKRSDQHILVIPIDDTDLNANKAYEIVEDIRKYLSLPNVVIIIATKIDQLAKMVEKQYRKDLQVLIEKRRIGEYELQQMSFRYIDKLIPDGRKIYLPKIRLLPNDSNIHAQVEYIDESNNRELLSHSKTTDFQGDVLNFLYSRTRLLSLKPLHGLHPIIPGTMRELVNFLAVINTMPEITATLPGEESCTQLLSNLDSFLHYFATTWINSNVDDGYIQYIEKLLSAPLFEKHRSIIFDILDIIDNTDIYSLTYRWKKNMPTDKPAIDAANDPLQELVKFSSYIRDKKLLLEYSIGDVMDALCLLEDAFPYASIKLFCFAVRTIYSVISYKLYLNMIMTDSQYKAAQANLEEWVGGDLFGQINESKFFPQSSVKISLHNFSIDWNKLQENEKKFVYGHYQEPTQDYLQYKEELSPNKTPFPVASFSPTAYIYKDIVRERKAPVDVGLFFFDMNVINHIIQIQPQLPNKDESILSNHILNFFDNIDRMIQPVRIVGNMISQDAYVIFGIGKIIGDYILTTKSNLSIPNLDNASAIISISQSEIETEVVSLINLINSIRPRTQKANTVTALRYITSGVNLRILKRCMSIRDFYDLSNLSRGIIRSPDEKIQRKKELLVLLNIARDAIVRQYNISINKDDPSNNPSGNLSQQVITESQKFEDKTGELTPDEN